MGITTAISVTPRNLAADLFLVVAGYAGFGLRRYEHASRSSGRSSGQVIAAVTAT